MGGGRDHADKARVHLVRTGHRTTVNKRRTHTTTDIVPRIENYTKALAGRGVDEEEQERLRVWTSL
jgi:hypothetical protein